MATDPRCPDCGVSMEPGRLRTGTHYIRLERDEPADGIAGSLGVSEKADVDAVSCPECGLVRLYADREEFG